MLGDSFENAENMSAKYGSITAIDKGYALEQWGLWASGTGRHFVNRVAVTTGIMPKEIDKATAILALLPEVPMICVDCAHHAWAPRYVVECVFRLRARFPTKTIITVNGGAVHPEETAEPHEAMTPPAKRAKIAEPQATVSIVLHTKHKDGLQNGTEDFLQVPDAFQPWRYGWPSPASSSSPTWRELLRAAAHDDNEWESLRAQLAPSPNTDDISPRRGGHGGEGRHRS